MSPIATILGANVRDARRTNAVTQAQLAERVSRSVETISNLERGKLVPGVETLLMISEALKVPLSTLVKGLGPTDAPAANNEQDSRVGRLAALLERLDERQLDAIEPLLMLLAADSPSRRGP